MSSVEIDRQWTTRLRKRVEGKLPPEKVLPDTQPSYVSSWIYVFGVATLTSFTLVLLTGCALALRGPHQWLFTFGVNTSWLRGEVGAN